MIAAEGLGLSRRTCAMLHAEMTGKAECFGPVLSSLSPCLFYSLHYLIVLFLSLDNTQTQSEVNLHAHIHSHLFMISVSCTKAVCSSDFLPRPLELVDVLSTCAKRIILRIFLYFGLIPRFVTTTFMHLSVFFQFSGFAIIFSVCECGYTKLMVPTAIKRQHSGVNSFLSLWYFLVLALCVLQTGWTTIIWLASLSYLSSSLRQGWSCRCMPLQPVFGVGSMHATAATVWHGFHACHHSQPLAWIPGINRGHPLTSLTCCIFLEYYTFLLQL